MASRPINVLSKEVNGAILTEKFSGKRLNTALWREWIQDRALKLEQRRGTFSIFGTTGDPVFPQFKGFRFTGLVSKKHLSRDAVLVARMRVPTGISVVPGTERYIVHLCGSVPDYFLEIVYGKDERGRRGWFQYWLSHRGFFFDTAPVFPKETADKFRDIKIEYSHADKSARGFLLTSSGWQPVGEPVELSMSSMKVELKVNCPINGATIHAVFKDCRLYPRPSSAPVEFIAYRWPAPLYLCPNIRIRLLESGSGRIIGETVTDSKWATGKISLPDDLMYPLSCRVEAFRGTEKVSEGEIKAKGVEGLYPGDLWSIYIPQEPTSTPFASKQRGKP